MSPKRGVMTLLMLAVVLGGARALMEQQTRTVDARSNSAAGMQMEAKPVALLVDGHTAKHNRHRQAVGAAACCFTAATFLMLAQIRGWNTPEIVDTAKKAIGVSFAQRMARKDKTSVEIESAEQQAKDTKRSLQTVPACLSNLSLVCLASAIALTVLMAVGVTVWPVLQKVLLEAWRSPSNVEWCEAVTHAYEHSTRVKEYWNTLSSAPYVVAGVMGVFRDVRWGWPQLVMADIAIVVTGLGTAVFHARDNYLGQMLDEVAMSVLVTAYFAATVGTHWLMRPPWIKITVGAVMAPVVCSWVLYFVFHVHWVFIAIFTYEVVVVVVMVVTSDRVPGSIFSPQHWLAWAAIGSLALGRVLWDVERRLHRDGACPTSQLDPLFWLHPVWHLLGCASHVFTMLFFEKWLFNTSETPSC